MCVVRTLFTPSMWKQHFMAAHMSSARSRSLLIARPRNAFTIWRKISISWRPYLSFIASIRWCAKSGRALLRVISENGSFCMAAIFRTGCSRRLQPVGVSTQYKEAHPEHSRTSAPTGATSWSSSQGKESPPSAPPCQQQSRSVPQRQLPRLEAGQTMQL